MDAQQRAIVDKIEAVRVEVAALSTEVRGLIRRVDPALADHEKRLRAVEKWQWQRDALLTLGGGGVGAALLTAYLHLTGGGL